MDFAIQPADVKRMCSGIVSRFGKSWTRITKPGTSPRQPNTFGGRLHWCGVHWHMPERVRKRSRISVRPKSAYEISTPG